MGDLRIVSWDGHSINDGTNYIAGFADGHEWGLPPITVQVARRTGIWPVIGGIQRDAPVINLVVQIVNTSNVRQLRNQLLLWFDPDDDTPKKLIVENTDGTNDRYIYAICERLIPQDVAGMAADTTFLATLIVHDDARWRSTTQSSHTWSVNTSGQTTIINNAGSADAYPTIKIKPTSGSANSFSFGRFVPIYRQHASSEGPYPMMATMDTASLVTAGKMQPDGDDLRVFIDGVETERWLSAMNTASTKIWFNVSFSPDYAKTLASPIPATGTIAEIAVNEDIGYMPSSGILAIGNEIFTYTSRDYVTKKFFGITRAAKGSSSAAHSSGDAVRWIQHDIWIYYGNSSLTNPGYADYKKPAFNIDSSTNSQWIYNDFGQGGGYTRAKSWSGVTYSRSSSLYVGPQHTNPYPYNGIYDVIGASQDASGSSYAYWYLSVNTGISSIVWGSGYKRRSGASYSAYCQHYPLGGSAWTTHYTVPSPSASGTWEAENFGGTTYSFAGGAQMVRLYITGDVGEIEAGSATVNLFSPPTVMSLPSEVAGVTTVALTLKNNTNGTQFTINYSMSVNQELQVDCDNYAVVYLADNSNQFASLSVPNGAPRWFALEAGNNTLEFVNNGGATNITFTISYEKRYY